MAKKLNHDSASQAETEKKSNENANEEVGLNEEVKVNEETNDNAGLPIDRGWAWMILAGCFLNAVLVIGYNRSLSLFFVEFLDIFQASAATTTLVMGVKSLSLSLFSLVTMHVLLEFWGIRKTVLLGGTLFTVAIMSSSFAHNITSLIFAHILLGIAQSMIHSPGLVLISKYFKKRRGLATTTASSAISLSSGVFPLIAQNLLDRYGIRGAMLIISGMTLNMWVGAGLYRPLVYFKQNKNSTDKDKEETESMLKDNDNVGVAMNDRRCRNHKVNETHIYLQVNEDNEITSSLSRSFETYKNFLSLDNDEPFRRRTFSEGSKYKHCATAKYKHCDTISQSEKLAYASNPGLTDVSVVDLHQHVDKTDSDSDGRKKEMSPLSRNFRQILKAFDFSLFKKPIFLLIAAFSHVGVIIRLAQLYLPARVNELGFSQSDAAILLLITGILDFFCRIFYGFLADLKFLKVQYIMAIGLFITGLATQFMALYTTFPLLVTYAVLNGIFGSAYQCLLPVVIVEFIGIDYLAKTLGFLSLFQGFASGISHPIVGGIRDLSGSYVACYYYMGTSSFLAAGLLMCEPLVRKFSKEKQMKKDRQNGNDLTNEETGHTNTRNN